MIPAIHDRRSIRKFQNKPLSREDITDILQSGIQAPSSKNRQPWKYIVVQGAAKAEMLKAFRAGILREETGRALLPDSRKHLAGAKYTVEILEQAPAVIFALNPLGKSIASNLSLEDRVYEICNI